MNDFEKRKCHELISDMFRKDLTRPFREKVDPERDGAPDYLEIVKQPMDLSTVKKKLAAGEYKTIDLFTSDVNLIWKNAKLYNEEGTLLHLIARELEEWFANKIAKLPRNKEEEWMLQLLKSSQRMSILAHHVPQSIVPMSEHPLPVEPPKVEQITVVNEQNTETKPEEVKEPPPQTPQPTEAQPEPPQAPPAEQPAAEQPQETVSNPEPAPEAAKEPEAAPAEKQEEEKPKEVIVVE
ncbi:Bromodomain containing protein [Trichomonas vaginalis G3]|uniref:Bromodomain containing protein n=1 Tax=Trichomonas vaginalis (strain ATCC PRA-98 / G3) TaxID=412133 RepID=A2EBE5_TRIV3|nr:acetylation-dependent protein binding [Trichomonas vaginalis G3]EAY09975.1 Bromodomain containing protein [Trichomonas vaginalis G3]KAI5535052.1 acetylation-dependent protein binding [Trichomonas vaginalis G3]|eukprot:XP_001322198.1 Bromodomain containing protein [Trichomonas vaginalis G3]